MKQKLKILFLPLFLLSSCQLKAKEIPSDPVEDKKNPEHDKKDDDDNTKKEPIGEVPLFYGTSSIVIDKDVIESFDPYDSRYRVYCRDYEDGDISSSIVVTYNDVVPTVPGTYKVMYEVIDSGKNKVEYTVPVEVKETSEGNSIIDRRVYAIPAMKNMADIGLERCNKGDMQNLGIYLPKGSKATLSYVSEEDHPASSTITNLTNTRKQNSFSYIKTGETSTTIYNIRDNVEYDCIPLLTSPRLEDETIDKTFQYRLSYGKEVKPLTYYHMGDKEEDFFSSWKENQDSYALIDSEAIQFVAPYQDIDSLVGEDKTFKTLDSALSYYLEVINRMDKMVGLSFDTDNPLDKNYRTKYLALADAGYSGAAAYYMGTYIAVCSSSISAFFTYGWGTIHELGHGYQGYFGKGTGGGTSLNFGETGNNILAHYIQVDKTLYTANGDWLGSLSSIEESLNQPRREGINIFTASGTYAYAKNKLYFMINLLDAFGGEKVYGEMFSYYRKAFSGKGNIYTIPDIYAMFFYEKYNANIIPYLNSWKLDVSDSTKKTIINSDSTSYVIPKDVLSDSELSSYKEKNDGVLLYAPTNENSLEKKDNVSLNVSLSIEDISKLKGKYIGVRHNGKYVTKKKIESESFTIDNLYRGNFEIVFPSADGYDMDEVRNIYVTGNSDSITESYTKVEESFDHMTTLKLLGKVYKTVGFEMSFSDYYQKASLTFGGSNLGNQNNWWKENFDTVCASVKVKDKEGTILYDFTVKGQQYFSSLENKVSSIDLEYGYTIEVYHYFGGSYVNVYSKSATDTSAITSYQSNETTKTYEVTQYGLKRTDIEDFSPKDVLYDVIKKDWISEIESLRNKLTDDSIQNRNIDVSIKNRIRVLYSYLKEEDRPSDVQSLFDRIQKGGAPSITVKNDTITIQKGATIDLYSLISIYDNEDFEIESNRENVSIDGEVDTSKEGSYPITYCVKDSDNNTTTKSITIVVE